MAARALLAWAKRGSGKVDKAHSKVGERVKAPIDTYELLRRRLTGEDVGGTISKRVLNQLQRSERALKGWQTRKEQHDEECRTGLQATE